MNTKEWKQGVVLPCHLQIRNKIKTHTNEFHKTYFKEEKAALTLTYVLLVHYHRI